MPKYDEDILDESVWVTATPAEGSVFMPFYITEIGRFYANENYSVSRDGHDSYMILYTVEGKGYIETENFRSELRAGEAVVFDCRSRHSYRTAAQNWDFFWIHLRGTGVDGLINAINYNGIRTVKIGFANVMEHELQRIIDIAGCMDICSMASVSSRIHTVLNTMLEDSISSGELRESAHGGEIREAVGYIEKNYTEQINIEDIISRIHVSKYYFIRLFKQYMGVTPYSYLINYRINQSKILLRTERFGIGEIALMTGFADVSNFINQFKKQTGQKPTEYRKKFLN